MKYSLKAKKSNAESHKSQKKIATNHKRDL